jgi:hypothetical protein
MMALAAGWDPFDKLLLAGLVIAMCALTHGLAYHVAEAAVRRNRIAITRAADLVVVVGVLALVRLALG